ncbi:hypothetical protein [Spirosoma pollinicola]|uniref:Uncharacterized protein n=1 Tax=Spirosoma pollinicola TaxID=2057025 RepID=A0A2K8YY83_9BACT|nr:hypothetical protein [Spirosoma pollinicola]AUD02559.1 hypothetical protein CWM47_12385 [Spirosoma pollinicola]
MKTPQLRSTEGPTPTDQLKASIRDMIRLQRDYQISDELFWEIFNTRVLLNEQIDIDEFICDFHRLPAYA